LSQRYAIAVTAASLDLGRIPFDLYATNRNNRLVLFCRAGFELTEQHKKTISSADRVFYISSDDIGSRVNSNEKTRMALGIGKRLVERLFSSPGSFTIFENTARFINCYTDLIINSPDAVDYILSASPADSYTFSHSMNVCTFSLLLGRRILGDDWPAWIPPSLIKRVP